MHRNFLSSPQRRLAVLLVTAFLLGATAASAHPLGNFTINHFTRIEVGSDRVKLHGVIDMAEIPAFQELDRIDTNGDGKASAVELHQYADQAAGQLADRLLVSVNGARVPLTVLTKNATLLAGAGGLETLRFELDLVGEFSKVSATEARDLRLDVWPKYRARQ